MIKIPECVLCGRSVKILNKAEIEGVVIEVCNRCTVFGKRITEIETHKKDFKLIRQDLQEKEWELMPDYGKYIKKVRESKGLTLEEFANKIKEKESVIKRIEAGLMEPNQQLLEKIEKFLGINLKIRYEEKYEKKSGKKDPELTLGDVVKIN